MRNWGECERYFLKSMQTILKKNSRRFRVTVKDSSFQREDRGVELVIFLEGLTKTRYGRLRVQLRLASLKMLQLVCNHIKLNIMTKKARMCDEGRVPCKSTLVGWVTAPEGGIAFPFVKSDYVGPRPLLVILAVSKQLVKYLELALFPQLALLAIFIYKLHFWEKSILMCTFHNCSF